MNTTPAILAAWIAAWVLAVSLHLLLPGLGTFAWAAFLHFIGAEEAAARGPAQEAFNVLAQIAPRTALHQAIAITLTLLFAMPLARGRSALRAMIFALTGALAPIAVSLMLGGFDLSGAPAGALAGLLAASLTRRLKAVQH